MNRVVLASTAALIALSAYAAPASEPLKLTLGAEDKYTAQAQRNVDGLHLDKAHVEMLEAFTVKQDDKDVAAFVSGTAIVPNASKHANLICFTALTEPDTGSAPEKSVALHVGQGDWEPETCGQLAAIGLLPEQSTDTDVRVGTLFTATTADGKALEPVILVWNRPGHSLAVDKALTAKAAKAGPKTLANIKAALNAP